MRWDSLYSTCPPYQPVVDHELDTQNFERFDEVAGPDEGATPRRRSRDPNFVGYTYKNFNATPTGQQSNGGGSLGVCARVCMCERRHAAGRRAGRSLF